MSKRSVSPLTGLSEALTEIVSRVMPCVVSLWGTNASLDSSAGSGWKMDEFGHVVTNHHVVDGLAVSPTASVGGVQTTAEIVGVDELTDLAVLKLADYDEKYLWLRNEPVRLGEICLAMGSPLGLYPESVSFGVVGGLARSLPQPDGRRPIEHAIQTDAAINPGNSGGPLVDTVGSLIGTNQSGHLHAQGLNFAIPADTIGYVTQELIQFGKVQRAALGVSIATEPVLVGAQEVVRLVVARRGDQAAGDFRIGDVLMDIDEQRIADRGDLFRVLSRERIDKKITVRLLRDGREILVEATPKALD